MLMETVSGVEAREERAGMQDIVKASIVSNVGDFLADCQSFTVLTSNMECDMVDIFGLGVRS